MLFAFVVSLVRFRHADNALKILSILLGGTFISECIAYYAAGRYHNNMPVYSIFSLVEFSLISLYFNYSIEYFRKRRIGIIIAALGTVAGIINIIYLQPLNVLNNYFLFLEGILIISMALFSFTRLMIIEDATPMHLNPHFWIAAIFTFFWAVTFLNWGLYDYLIAKYRSKMWVANLSILIVNMITYTSIGLVFIFYPKLRVRE